MTKRRDSTPVVFTVREVLTEHTGASEVGRFTRAQYPGFGQGNEVAGAGVNPR